MNTTKRLKGGNSYLIANCVLLVCLVTLAFVASLFVISQASATTQADAITDVQAPVPPQVKLDDEVIHFLHEEQNELVEKDNALEVLHDMLKDGYVVAKDVNVTESDRAYWLSEPKLMLGVNRLSGGSLLISFADQQEEISIGQRIDFEVDGCDCFLLLKSSTFGQASFRYACTPTTQEPARDSQNTLIDTKLN